MNQNNETQACSWLPGNPRSGEKELTIVGLMRALPWISADFLAPQPLLNTNKVMSLMINGCLITGDNSLTFATGIAADIAARSTSEGAADEEPSPELYLEVGAA